MACLNLLKVVDPQEHRVVKGVLHVVCIMARSETVRGILVGGKAMKQVVALLSEQQPEHVLSAVAMFLWRASCSHEGRSGLIAAGAQAHCSTFGSQRACRRIAAAFEAGPR